MATSTSMYGNFHLDQGSAEPMKHGRAEPRIFQKDGQYLLHGTSGLDAEGLAAEFSAPSYDGSNTLRCAGKVDLKR
ncbi:hypothetical protein Q3A80_27690 [Burkholderia sp. SR8]|jgi:hypothetical protein|uniref:hypothetical protein n=1 Tax=Burkholderia sp. SR8 TaxID=3062277 RepID=UPI004063F26E